MNFHFVQYQSVSTHMMGVGTRHFRLGAFIQDNWLGISGFRFLALSLRLGIWLRIFGWGPSALDLWLGIFGLGSSALGSLALDRWLWVVALESLGLNLWLCIFWRWRILGLGNWDPKDGGSALL